MQDGRSQADLDRNRNLYLRRDGDGCHTEPQNVPAVPNYPELIAPVYLQAKIIPVESFSILN